ncbi:MAG: RDD family protein [Proteobacteria bacterium]|jgi:uncharacterized RDD family membrane protein YckC|nr:RDD family protein [Alphaproteobacteria bacterium]NCC04057.1 RDD family protein [Pseudomonadota bacterium]
MLIDEKTQNMNPKKPTEQNCVRLPHEEDSVWEYAGFLWRALSRTIDLVILLALNALLVWATYHILRESQFLPPVSLRAIFGTIALVSIQFLIVLWLYTGCLESSAWQGTLGMKLCGLIVVDEQGRPITFGRSSCRFFLGAFAQEPGTLNAALVVLTKQKQDLEDMVSETLVLRRKD